MDEQQQKNQSEAFEKSSLDKGLKTVEKINDKKKKAQKIKRIIKILLNPITWKILAVITIIIGGTILVTGFIDIIGDATQKETNEAKKGAVSVSMASPSSGENTNNTAIVIKPTQDNDSYEITTTYDDENIDDIRKELDEKYSNDLSDFNDFETKVIAGLEENGLDLDSYTTEELKCLPAFLKAESCTKFLDLRPNDQKFDENGEYKPAQVNDEDNKVPGVILVQRTNTNTNIPTTLEYKEENVFNDLIASENEEDKKKALRSFTINENGELVFATSRRYTVTVDIKEREDYPAELGEEEKVKPTDQYIIEKQSVNYSQLVAEYTMPFDFLTQLLVITEDPEFCLDVTDTVLGSKIIINIREEETITTTIEEKTYDIYNREIKRINYNISPNLENKENYIIRTIKNNNNEVIIDDTQDNYTTDDKENICTTYGKETLNVTVTTTNVSHVYGWEVIEVDTWLQHSIKVYDIKQSTPTTNKKTVDQIQDDYTIKLEEKDYNSDLHATKFAEKKEAYYRKSITIPKIKLKLGTKEIWDSLAQVWVEIPGDYEITIDNADKIKTTNLPDGKTSYKYSTAEELPQEIKVTTKKTTNCPFEVVHTYELNTKKDGYDWKYEDDGIKCNVEKLEVESGYKVDFKNDITETITKPPSYTYVQTNTDIYAKDSNGNFEKFLLAYDNNKKAVELMRDVDSWLFEMMEDNENTEELVDYIKYLLYIYDGTDYGITEMDLQQFMLDTIVMAGSYNSVGNVSAFGCTLERDEFISLAKNYKTDNSTYQSKMANYAGNFYDICTKYGVNPIIAYAHACLETGYGDSIPYNNYFGMAVYNGQNSGAKYSSAEESIEGYCNWVVNNATVGTSAYASNLAQAQKWATYNGKLSGTPDTNIYVLYCRYVYLGDTHICDEPDFSNPKGTDYYKSKGSNWGTGGRIYIYEMYENGGLYTGRYSELCGHKNANDPTTEQEKADYTVYTTNKRVNIAQDIFGGNIFSDYGNGEIGEKIVNAAERIRQHCADNNYVYNTSVPNYSEGVKALWNERGVCCASYVAWVLAEVGYEDLVNQCNFRGSTALGNHLRTVFPEVESYEEMQPGDIIIWPGHHCQIYAGNGYWYNGGAKNPTVKYSKYDAREAFAHYGDYYILRPQ